MNNKFIRIYEDIAAHIRNGEIEAGSLLPSELDLSESYQTSRETIRKALKMLYEEGYIQKIQGKGSIVLDIRMIDFPISDWSASRNWPRKWDSGPERMLRN